MNSRLIAALLAFATTPAGAAVTADQVWADWQRLATLAGTPLTASAMRQGDKLILSRLVLDLGDFTDPSGISLDRLVLLENPDGTVSVQLPDRFPVTLDLPPSPVADDPDHLTFTTSAPDLAITIAGLGDIAAFSVNAPSLTISLAPLDLPPGADETLTLTLAAADLSLDHKQDLAAPMNAIDTALSLGTLHADMAVSLKDREGGTFSVDLAALKGKLAAVVPTALAHPANELAPDLPKALAAGLSLSFAVSHDLLAVSADAMDPDAPVSFQLTSASGAARTSLDQTGFAFDATSGATRWDAKLADPTIPVTDVEIGYTQIALGLTTGLAFDTDPQNFTSHLRVTDLALGNALWAEMDPAAEFPRDPLSLALALSGSAAIKPGALLPGWQPKSDADLPVDILSVSLDELLLSGIGAQLTGTGALTFDNADVVTFDGLPAPTGMLGFAATGINALIDRAAGAGLITADDLPPLRFGLAFIARPGDGPDTLTTRIEFRDKSLYLNGQKLR
jgi:Uncharacterized protein conserved in bacteria (DUF2125)